MSHHETRTTESVTGWCNHCGKNTQHAASGGRRGRCMEHSAPHLSKKQIATRQKREDARRNPVLWPEDANP